MSSCASCPYQDKFCINPNGKGADDCPTINNKKEIDTAKQKYKTEEFNYFCIESIKQEGAGYDHDADGDAYAVKTRLQEIIEFGQRMNYKKLGLAFCAGLKSEAAILNKILIANGFEVVSAICKVGSIKKEDLNVSKEYKIYPDKYEPMCNPIAQAEILNEAHTEFNIVLGLCVGHDSMFFKNSEAMCTVFAVKDRVLANNPLGAIYTSNSYYKWLTKPLQQH
jgi:uncharacterized metal-binding protein